MSYPNDYPHFIPPSVDLDPVKKPRFSPTVSPISQDSLTDARRAYSRAGFALSVMLLVYLTVPSILALLLQLFGKEISVKVSYFLSSLSLYAVAMPIFVLMTKPRSYEAPERHKLSMGKLLLSYLLCVPLLYLGSYVGMFFDFVGTTLSGKEASGLVEQATENLGLSLTFLFVVILAPIFEELLFRKCLLDQIGRYGYAPAIALSGLVFGLIHGNFQQFFYAMLLGFFFAFLYLRTGRVRYTIILHMLVNFFGSIVPMLLQSVIVPLENPVSGSALSRTVLQAAEGASLPGMQDVLVALTGLYAVLLLGAMIAGFVLLLVFRRRFTLPEADKQVPLGKEHRLFLTPGIIVYLLLCALLFAISLV